MASRIWPWRTSNSDTVSVFINNGAGTFAAKVDYTTGTSPTSVAVGDSTAMANLTWPWRTSPATR